jgi:DNA polymerase I-like protein with 3'-5' exonuclease and polymerase domains
MTTLYLDIENSGEPWDGNLLLVGYAYDDEPVRVVEPDDLIPVGAGLADPAVTKVSQSTHDPRWLTMAGYKVAGPWHDTKVMAWVLNENTPLDIEWLAKRYAGVVMDKRLKRSGGRIYFRDDDGTLYDLAEYEQWRYEGAGRRFENYCARDVNTLRDLYRELRFLLDETQWESYWLNEEAPYTSVLFRMEARGLPIDLKKVALFAEELEAEVLVSGTSLMEEAGLPDSFNLNSHQQMVAYLFSRAFTLKDRLPVTPAQRNWLRQEAGATTKYKEVEPWQPPESFTVESVGTSYVNGYWTLLGRGLKATEPTVNKVTGEKSKLPSVSSPELLFLHSSDPWVLRLCTTYRKQEKLLTTYLRVFPKVAHEGRIYARFNQTGTVTGRLSSSGPNLQNQPARGDLGLRTRGLFVGPFIIGDYDQLEMRLMAHFSEDRQLLRVFREGLDPHLRTAQAIFGEVDEHGEERGIGKTLNFAIGYGAGAKKVAQVLSLAGYPTTKPVAAGYLAELQGFYKGFYRWKEVTSAAAKRHGSVRTLGGRRRRLKGAFRDTANWKAVSYGERQAVNAIIQGSAADILRRVMVELDDVLPWVPMLAQVHDELIFEAPSGDGRRADALGFIERIAQTRHKFDLRVPLLFEPQVCETWADKGEGTGLADLFIDEEEEEEE